MACVFLLNQAQAVRERRGKLPRGTLAEAWPDLFEAGLFWVPEASKALLDQAGGPLTPVLSVQEAAVPIFYPIPPTHPDSLPETGSLLARVLAGHGIAVAWVGAGEALDRVPVEPVSMEDAFFFLRRAGGPVNHLWRLFRSRDDARAYAAKELRGVAEAEPWAGGLPASFEELLHRCRGGPPSGDGRPPVPGDA